MARYLVSLNYLFGIFSIYEIIYMLFNKGQILNILPLFVITGFMQYLSFFVKGEREKLRPEGGVRNVTGAALIFGLSILVIAAIFSLMAKLGGGSLIMLAFLGTFFLGEFKYYNLVCVLFGYKFYCFKKKGEYIYVISKREYGKGTRKIKDLKKISGNVFIENEESAFEKNRINFRKIKKIFRKRKKIETVNEKEAEKA